MNMSMFRCRDCGYYGGAPLFRMTKFGEKDDGHLRCLACVRRRKAQLGRVAIDDPMKPGAEEGG